MAIHNALFSIARQISDGNLDEINKIEERANNQTMKLHSGMGGIKGWYAKQNNEGWILPLISILAVPFISKYLLSLQQRMVDKTIKGESFEDDDYTDEDERELFNELQQKYGNK